MPTKYGRKKTYKRKPYKRRLYKRKARLLAMPKIQKSLSSGMPRRVFIKLVYTESHNFTSTAINQYAWRSSLYDPNATGTGDQPLLATQLFAMYGNCRVRGTHIRLDLQNTGSVLTDAVLTPSVQAAVFSTDISVLRGIPGSKHTLLGAQGSNNDKRTLSLYASTKRYHATKDMSDDPQHTGSNQANPDKMVYFHITLVPDSGDNSVRAMLIMHFYCEFFNPVRVTY